MHKFLFWRREQLYTGGEVTDDEKMYTKWVEANLTKEIWFFNFVFVDSLFQGLIQDFLMRAEGWGEEGVADTLGLQNQLGMPPKCCNLGIGT